MSDLRLDDLLKLGDCVICGRKQLDSHFPTFYVVEVSQAGFDGAAVRRAAGLELQVGPLARVLGPDEPLAKVIDGPRRFFVHEVCAEETYFRDLIECAADRKPSRAEIEVAIGEGLDGLAARLGTERKDLLETDAELRARLLELL